MAEKKENKSKLDKKELERQLEALLFLLGEPVKLKKLADILGVKPKEIEEALGDLRKTLVEGERGLELVEQDGIVQLVTNSKYGDLLAGVAKEDLDNKLTPAALETLAVVAYLGPCKRSFIDHIRGVNSSFILRNLMIRGLVERTPDKERANALAYQVTLDFLKHMGVGSAEELPGYEKYREFVRRFKGEGSGGTDLFEGISADESEKG